MSKRVILESTYAGDIARNIEYARRCLRDSLLRGEYPFASHLLYTQEGVLDDSNPDERKLGIEADLEWGRDADITVAYIDYGISEGIAAANRVGRTVEYRTIGKNPE